MPEISLAKLKTINHHLFPNFRVIMTNCEKLQIGKSSEKKDCKRWQKSSNCKLQNTFIIRNSYQHTSAYFDFVSGRFLLERSSCLNECKSAVGNRLCVIFGARWSSTDDHVSVADSLDLKLTFFECT